MVFDSGDNMLQTYTVAFFGHRYIDNVFAFEDQLEQLIHDIIETHAYTEFLVGRDGEFDQIVSSTIIRVKRKYRNDNSAHVWVLPYAKADFLNNEEDYRKYYDEIEICEESSTAHYKAALQIRNRIMVDRADLIICYIDHESGGAYQTINYATSQTKISSILQKETKSRSTKVEPLVLLCFCEFINCPHHRLTTRKLCVYRPYPYPWPYYRPFASSCLHQNQ